MGLQLQGGLGESQRDSPPSALLRPMPDIPISVNEIVQHSQRQFLDP